MVGMPCDLRRAQHQVIALDDGERQSLLLEHRADGAADASVTDHDGVLAQRGGAAHGNAMLVRATPLEQRQ